MAQVTLYGLSYSPWSERARWALDHHRITYRYREHIPFLGEPWLRFLRRGMEGASTVPLLIDGPTRLGDSKEIFAYADRRGSGSSLGSTRSEVRDWIALLEPVLAELRVRVTRRTLRDSDALREAAEAATPAFLAGFARPVAAMGARHIGRKYGFAADELGFDHEFVTERLSELETAVASGSYLAGTFSAADITAASVIQGFCPHEGVRMGEATRKTWKDEQLVGRFPTLIDWRDTLYRNHRPRRQRANPTERKAAASVAT